MKTVDEILKAEKFGDIFQFGDKNSIKSQYRELARLYHPDIYKGKYANQIMEILNKFYGEALNSLESGKWEASNIIEVKSVKGTKITQKYRESFSFELGTEYVSDSIVLYIFKKNYKKFFDNAVKRIQKICSGDKNSPIMKEFYRYLPELLYSFEIIDGSFCIVVKKEKQIVPLSLILKHYNGSIPAEHVAWMISRLCNICCFFEHNAISHNGLTIENLYVNPDMHSIHVLGGWWYSTPINERLIGVPKFVYDVMPVKEKGQKIGATITDIETIKRTAMVLLGGQPAPKPMMDFLKSGSSNNAIEEFCKWSKALEGAYGKRRFVPMGIAIDQIYKK